jgi:hypothetical protein
MIGGSIPCGGWEFFSSPRRPDRLWSPLSLLSMGNRGFFSAGKAVGAWKLTTYLHLVPRSRIRGAIPPLPSTPSWRGAQLKRSTETLPLPLPLPLRYISNIESEGGLTIKEELLGSMWRKIMVCFKYYPNIFLEWLKRTTKIPQDILPPGQESNTGLLL